jgi:saccharopine dehydrogenase (NAD+, L-lysine-forming)
MPEKLKIGILRETKNPPDKRVPLTPDQIISLEKRYPDVNFIVQHNKIRCFSDYEYETAGIPVMEDISDCEIIMGIKEVDKKNLIPDKTYIFFAHVGKKQPYNREMLQEILKKRIRLIDYEYLENEKGERIVAFGRYAGIVGAYNALRAYGIRSGMFELKPAHECFDLREMWKMLSMVELKAGLKILVTGTGRVANGAMETLRKCNILVTNPVDYLSKEFETPVVCQIGPENYVRKKLSKPFDLKDFYTHPDDYESTFKPFTGVTDIYITGHYWNPRSPVFFTRDNARAPEFRISVIADISCDINGPVPSTLRASTIDEPFYGYDPFLEKETAPFSNPSVITVMAVDNLPGELPRDASTDFGNQLTRSLFRDILSGIETPMIGNATVTAGGQLTERFKYLEDFINNNHL